MVATYRQIGYAYTPVPGEKPFSGQMLKLTAYCATSRFGQTMYSKLGKQFADISEYLS